MAGIKSTSVTLSKEIFKQFNLSSVFTVGAVGIDT